MKLKTKYLNHLGKDDIIQSRMGIPEDYHCTCNLCDPETFMGEIYNLEYDTYYSNRIREGYYVNKGGEHLDVGQFVGYRWAIQNLCPVDGWVLDPTVGTGTAIVEAINNGRNGIGIELEYPEVAQRNIDHQETTQKHFFRQGDARHIDEYLDEWGVSEESVDLIVNGPPYPTVGGRSADAPQRDWKNENKKAGKGQVTFDYMHKDSIGLLKDGPEWADATRSYFSKTIPYLKTGGYLVLLIKDMVQNKQARNLHKETADLILGDNPHLVHKGFFIHKHVPTTMFMNTYPKRFPEVKIPWYQTGVVLQKI